MKLNLIVLPLLSLGFLACGPSELILIENGTSNYEIILPDVADTIEMKSAYELQKYLKLKTGVVVKVSREGKTSSDHQILIGNTSKGLTLKALEHEVIIKAIGDDVIIFGGFKIKPVCCLCLFGKLPWMQVLCARCGGNFQS